MGVNYFPPALNELFLKSKPIYSVKGNPQPFKKYIVIR